MLLFLAISLLKKTELKKLEFLQVSLAGKDMAKYWVMQSRNLSPGERFTMFQIIFAEN